MIFEKLALNVFNYLKGSYAKFYCAVRNPKFLQSFIAASDEAAYKSSHFSFLHCESNLRDRWSRGNA